MLWKWLTGDDIEGPEEEGIEEKRIFWWFVSCNVGMFVAHTTKSMLFIAFEGGDLRGAANSR